MSLNAHMTILLTFVLLNGKQSLSSTSFELLLLISKSREENAY